MKLSWEGLLAYFPRMSYPRYLQLLAAFSSIDEALATSRSAYIEKLPWKEELIDSFFYWKKNFDINEAVDLLEKESIHIVSIKNELYPGLLKEIHDPPLCLFVKGSLKKLHFPISIVGTRRISTYGKHVTEQIVSELSSMGLSIISGLAFGIDSIAHQTTLESNGKTIAVLGSGVDNATLSPRAHLSLARNIVKAGGAVVSEYPPKMEGTRYTFPKRNRLIAGMSLGTLVVEAGEKSGALITARCALEENREVFAVPHDITRQQSKGPNTLIKNGAHVATSAKDIVSVLQLDDVPTYIENSRVLPDLSNQEREILELLPTEPCHIDTISRSQSISPKEIRSLLTLLEMKGLVKNVGNMTYIKRN